jgi:uncharacterized protein (DUF58 family)
MRAENGVGQDLHAARSLRRRLFRRVRMLQIRCTGLINQELAGSYDSALKGAGIEFEETRPYQLGDDARTIDWRVTARTGEPFVRRFREERALAVHLLVDVSGSMVGPRPERSVHDVAVEVSALVALLAAHAGDHIGLTLFSDRIEKEVPPAGGVQHALRILRDLLKSRPAEPPVDGGASADRGTDTFSTGAGCSVGLPGRPRSVQQQRKRPQSPGTRLGEALARVCRTQRRRGVVVLVSDFLADGIDRPLQVASRQHQLMPIILNEPADRQLPRWGLLRTCDPETGRRVWIDAFSRRQHRDYEAAVERRSAALNSLLGQLHVPGLKLTPQSDVVSELRHYLQAWSRPR